MTYELIPNDGRKSFYGKARVFIKDGSETLYSYGTPVLHKTQTGELFRIEADKGFSQTTCRHVKAFCGLDKSQYRNLPKVAFTAIAL